MNRSLIALGTSVAALGLAAGAPLLAGAGSAAGAAPRTTPIWAEAPCQNGATITVKNFYDTDSESAQRVITVHGLEPNVRARVQIAVYQGDVGSIGVGHERANDEGVLLLDGKGTSGFHRVDVRIRTHGGERCRVELAGRVVHLP